MPRPVRKPRRLLLTMTAADYDALKRDAGDCPLGPWIVQRALTQALWTGYGPSWDEAERIIKAAESPAPVLSAPGIRATLQDLDAWVDGLDRLSTSKGPLLRLLPQLAALVRDA